MTLVGKSAAAVWGFPLGRIPRQVEMARADGRGGSAAAQIQLRVLALIPEDPLCQLRKPYHRGRVTGHKQTLIDTARWHGVSDAVVAMDYCLHQQIVTKQQLKSILDTYQGFRGRKFSAQAVQLSHAATESPRESMIRVRIWECGLPAPHVQATLRNERGEFIGRADLFYPEFSLAIEYDGESKYTGAFGISPEGAMYDEMRRQRELLAAGIRLIRVDRENYRDQTWLRNLRREIEVGTRAANPFPRSQWTSEGVAW